MKTKVLLAIILIAIISHSCTPAIYKVDLTGQWNVVLVGLGGSPLDELNEDEFKALSDLLFQTSFTFINDSVAKVVSPFEGLSWDSCSYAIIKNGEKIFFRKTVSPGDIEFFWVYPKFNRKNGNLVFMLEDFDQDVYIELEKWEYKLNY